ncbi:unnamed protein product [Amoebophrya sp. A25]|nr:unnamed protein product [Amoebophrya sp. A25]|eukprot:GSA25T00022490001.1
MRLDEAWLEVEDDESLSEYLLHSESGTITNEEEEDESEEFSIAYCNSADRVFVANLEPSETLSVVEATSGSTAAKAVTYCDRESARGVYCEAARDEWLWLLHKYNNNNNNNE